MRWNTYIARKLLSGGYGMLYNWFCTQQQAAVKYGYLYNWYAASDSRGFVVGWHVPTDMELTTLSTTLGGESIAGGKLKETGLTHWENVNLGATNETGFTARGGGYRNSVFYAINNFGYWWSSTQSNTTNAWSRVIYNTYPNLFRANYNKNFGQAIRLIKDDSTDPGFVVIDGVLYPTVKIGDQVWLAANLMAKHYANGDAIPEVTDNTAWAALTTGARCSYNNLESNAGKTKKLSSSDDWVVPTAVQLLNTSLPDYNVSKLMEAGFTHWNESNIGTNTTGFGLVGTGYRSDVDGIFNSLKGTCHVWISNLTDGTAFIFISGNTDATASSGINMGRTIRLCNPATTHADGYVGSYTQNDGTTIPTIVINGVEWTMNLRETKWSDGTDIQNVTDNTAWSLLKSAACCDINNDLTNR